MTPLSSLRQNTANHFSNTSTFQDQHIQFTVKEPSHNKAHFHSFDTLVATECNKPSAHQSYRKPTYTDQYLHWGQQSFYNSQTKCIQHIGKQGQNSLIQLGSLRPGTFNISGGPYRLASFQTGHLTNFNKKFKGATNLTRTPITRITPLILTTPPTATTGLPTLWSHTFREQEKDSKRFANAKAYKYISRVLTPPEHYWSHQRTRIKKLHKSGVIYHFKCLHITCPDAYIEESEQGTGRKDQGTSQGTFSNSPAQHFHRTSSKPRMFQHYTQGSARNICQKTWKQCLLCDLSDPSLNRNLVKYQLPHIWDNILQDTPALQLR